MMRMRTAALVSSLCAAAAAQITVTGRRYVRAEDPTAFQTEADNAYVATEIDLDPAATALVLVDVWDDSASAGLSDNENKRLLPLLEKAASAEDPARIVNLGSVMGAAPLAENVYSYAASKAAVHHLTRCLAKEFAARHITVNAFAPGPFQSKMTAFATGTDEKAAAVGRGVPMGRIGAPDDIAGAALFLCGRGGAYTTGAILPLDGGIGVETGHELFEEH